VNSLPVEGIIKPLYEILSFPGKVSGCFRSFDGAVDYLDIIVNDK